MINWLEIKKAVKEYKSIKSEARNLPIIDFLKWCEMKYKENIKKAGEPPRLKENSTSVLKV